MTLDNRDRYILFAGSGFYPHGGMNDAKFSFDEYLEFDYHMESLSPEPEWFHLLDTHTFEVIKGIDSIRELVGSMRLKGKYMKDADLSTLPIGTEFYVENGCWEGKIIAIDGNKFVRIDEVDSTLPIRTKGSSGLDITIQ